MQRGRAQPCGAQRGTPGAAGSRPPPGALERAGASRGPGRGRTGTQRSVPRARGQASLLGGDGGLWPPAAGRGWGAQCTEASDGRGQHQRPHAPALIWNSPGPPAVSRGREARAQWGRSTGRGTQVGQYLSLRARHHLGQALSRGLNCQPVGLPESRAARYRWEGGPRRGGVRERETESAASTPGVGRPEATGPEGGERAVGRVHPAVPSPQASSVRPGTGAPAHAGRDFPGKAPRRSGTCPCSRRCQEAAGCSLSPSLWHKPPRPLFHVSARGPRGPRPGCTGQGPERGELRVTKRKGKVRWEERSRPGRPLWRCEPPPTAAAGAPAPTRSGTYRGRRGLAPDEGRVLAAWVLEVGVLAPEGKERGCVTAAVAQLGARGPVRACGVSPALRPPILMPAGRAHPPWMRLARLARAWGAVSPAHDQGSGWAQGARLPPTMWPGLGPSSI